MICGQLYKQTVKLFTASVVHTAVKILVIVFESSLNEHITESALDKCAFVRKVYAVALSHE